MWRAIENAPPLRILAIIAVIIAGKCVKVIQICLLIIRNRSSNKIPREKRNSPQSNKPLSVHPASSLKALFAVLWCDFSFRVCKLTLIIVLQIPIKIKIRTHSAPPMEMSLGLCRTCMPSPRDPISITLLSSMKASPSSMEFSTPLSPNLCPREVCI